MPEAGHVEGPTDDELIGFLREQAEAMEVHTGKPGRLLVVSREMFERLPVERIRSELGINVQVRPEGL